MVDTNAPPKGLLGGGHRTLTILRHKAMDLSEAAGIHTIVLAGGIFQNRLLLDAVSRNLTHCGLTVLHPQTFPPNDGGLSLGQAAIAAFAALNPVLMDWTSPS